MDDRQHAFLARQPSAALQTREQFLGMPKRGLAFLLANVMFWQPMWAQAEGIVVSAPGTGLDRAGNGVPIVNIAKPNGSGLSHNQFKDYNVGSNGVILNNATNRTQSTQLGGIILGNPNLNGTAAKIILNEVNGGNPSQLRGYTEVAGQSAHVIVANPYGISCNGCGFINTPKATLTTGKPIIENGQLSRYQVDQGSVAIEGAGLNASNVDRFEIITRSAKINAEIQAKNLTIVAGRNDVNAETLSATARADDGSVKPELAIDSSALGGMYAGAIKLVGTEAGVGVKLDGKLIASGGDIQLDANGHLSMVDTSASGAVNVKAASLDARGPVYAGTTLNAQTQGDLTNRQTLAAGDGIVLNAGGQLSNHGIIEAGVNADNTRNTSGDVSLTAKTLDNHGKSIVASRNLTTDVAQTLNNQGGTLSARQTATVKAGTLDNQNKGRVLSNGALNVTADKLLNTQGIVSSNGNLTVNAAQLNNNTGELSSLSNITLRVASLDNVAGLVAAGQMLDISASDQINNQSGRFTASKNAQLIAGSLDNRQGTLISTDALTLKATSLDNRQAGLIGATKTLALNVDELDNRGGELTGNADVTLVSQNLDNSDGGQVFAGQSLKLTVDKLLNRTKGLLSAKTELELDGGSLDNSSGYLISQQNQRINLSRDLLNNQGHFSSEGTLHVTAANLTNTGGSLSSAANLTVHSLGRLDNQGGELVTDGALSLTSAALDNRQQGRISAKGAVGVTTGAFDNSQNGRLNSGSTLNLVAGQVTNQDGGSIASQEALTASVTGLDQQGGTLFSNASLSLDMNNGQLNNQGGLINAPGTLLLKNLSGVNNQGGEISSAEAFTLAAQNLTNDNGKLLSSQSLTLRIAQALNNVKGMIGAATVDAQAQSLSNNGGTLTSRGNLVLTVDQQLHNQAQGLISAAQLLTLNSGNLNNQGGSVLAGGALVLNAMALNNSANGLINAQGDLTVDADSLDSSDGGEVSAQGDINLTLASLTQDGGRLLGEKAVTLNLGNGDLNNRNGLITAKGPLTFNALRDLNNQGGEISSSQSFDVKGRTLDNSGGKLISSQNLGLDGQALVNQNGLISGWQGLLVKGTSLDNRNNGTLSSRNGNVTLNLLGNLLNGNGGALVSQGSLGVTAVSVDNTKGILSSGGAQNLILSGALDNGQGGLIDSGAGLTIKATSVANVSGAVNAQQTLTLNANELNNRQGSLIGNAEVNLNLNGTLNNSGAKLASAGPLTVKGATAINNQGGQIASQDQMTLSTGSLDNSNIGTVAAKNALAITATGVVQNHTNGLIYSQTAGIELGAASLANGKGEMQGQTGLDLQLSGDLDNQGGKLIAQTGDVSVTAANIDNRGGTLAAIKGALEARTVGVLRNGFDVNNKGGVIQAQRLNLRALAGLNNNGGRIAAQAGDVIINMADLNNRNGGLYATGLINANGASLDNSAGQIAGNRIELGLSGILVNTGGILESDSTLAVRAANVNNQGGKLRALGTSGKTDFQIGGLFDNRNGVLESANNELTLNAAGFQNLGGSVLHTGSGTFDVSTANITNAGGSLVTRGALTLAADSWTNSSVIQAGRLTVNVNNLTQTATGQLLASTSLVGSGINWSNDGLIASDGNLGLSLSGTYSGDGGANSLGNLLLNAAQLEVGRRGRISGGGITTINGTGSVTNYGLLTGADGLIISGSRIENYGTLGSSQELVLMAGSLINDRALIFSQGDMSFRVGDFVNAFADVYSMADLKIDWDGFGGLASKITNNSSSIKSDGDLSLSAVSIENNRSDFVYKDSGIYAGSIVELSCGVIPGLDCSGSHQNGVFEVALRNKLEVASASAASDISAGGNISLYGDSLLNRSSTIAAGGNLLARLETLTNIGIVSGEAESRRIYVVPSNYKLREARKAADIFNIFYWPEYPTYAFFEEAQGFVESFLSNFISLTEREIAESHKVAQLDAGGQSYAAVIQAVGNIDIVASANINNSAIRNDYFYVAGSARVDTKASGTGSSTRINLNAQLPPDVAQQQVNPLTLPGFTLPSGQNGLFRLSGQGTSNASASQAPIAPQNWTISSSGVSALDRSAGVPITDVRPIEIADPSQLSATDRQVQLLNGAQTSAPPPASIAGQTLARVTGLPSATVSSKPHKYLIETNPVLTDLKSFTSSDYLLTKLGYDADTSAKRLGDGLFEQRLIQQAVVARTGQRFIDGQTSDDGMFRYLMNNAIASKDALNLSVGVTLTAQQVAALTHDIVWLEEHEVNGEKVLVPVLYMAQANNRLAPNGALIAGQNVTLIAGKDLENAGTLRATNNLSATASQNLANSGLIEAGNRLDMLAGNDIVNKSGGIIAGRDINMNAISGDVTNERTLTTEGFSNRGYTHRQDYADSASRIEAANDLTMGAGRDVNSVGSVMASGRDTQIDAGRDVNIISAQQQSSSTGGVRRSSITQLSSNVDAGRDVIVNAGRDFNAVASQISADRNVALAANENMTVSSGADESHYYYKSKKVTSQKDHVKQIGSTVSAGGDVSMSAGKDMALISSRVTAGDEAYLVAGENLDLLAAQDSDYSLYQKKKKGSWGKKQFRRDELTKVTHIGSQIITGGDLTLVSGGDQRYQVAKLNSGNDAALLSGGAITFEGVKDLRQESHTKSDTSLAWNSMKGKGNTDETLRQSQLVAKGDLVIKAVDGLNIDIKHINQKSVSQTIDAMVKADPELAWLKEAEKRGDVDWRRVEEIHQSFKYSNSGLGVAAQMVLAIVLAVVTGGAGAGLVGATAGTFSAGFANAVLIAVENKAINSAISNKGDLGAVLKDTTSSESLKGYVVSGMLGGIGNSLGYDPTKIGFDWNSAGQIVLKTSAETLVQTALQGGSLGDNFVDNLLGAVIDIGGAVAANKVGNLTLAEGSPTKIAAHALVGGLKSMAMGGDFKAGALAGGANEALVGYLAELALPEGYDPTRAGAEQDKANLLAMSQLLGVLTAVVSGSDPKIAADIAANATQYNFLGDHGYGQAAASLAEYMLTNGATAEEVSQAQRDLAQGEGFDGVQPANEFIEAWGKFVVGELTGFGLLSFIGRFGSWNLKATMIEFLPKATRNSAGQIETNITQGSAIKTLESSGYKKTISQDGSVTVLTNGEKTYRFYPSSTSTGQPSASLTIEGMKKPAAKIRFSGE